MTEWKADMVRMSEFENMVVKIGGLAMPVNGFNWHTREMPPSSEEVADAHREYYLHTIDAFGPSRCMFESNFPVDKECVSYRTLWNTFKRIASKAGLSESEKKSIFSGTAIRAYRLNTTTE